MFKPNVCVYQQPTFSAYIQGLLFPHNCSLQLNEMHTVIDVRNSADEDFNSAESQIKLR